jgi:hypothetical protein
MANKIKVPIFRFMGKDAYHRELPGGELAEVVELQINGINFQVTRYNRNNEDIIVSSKYSSQATDSKGIHQIILKELNEWR